MKSPPFGGGLETSSPASLSLNRAGAFCPGSFILPGPLAFRLGTPGKAATRASQLGPAADPKCPGRATPVPPHAPLPSAVGGRRSGSGDLLWPPGPVPGQRSALRQLSGSPPAPAPQHLEASSPGCVRPPETFSSMPGGPGTMTAPCRHGKMRVIENGRTGGDMFPREGETGTPKQPQRPFPFPAGLGRLGWRQPGRTPAGAQGGRSVFCSPTENGTPATRVSAPSGEELWCGCRAALPGSHPPLAPGTC